MNNLEIFDKVVEAMEEVLCESTIIDDNWVRFAYSPLTIPIDLHMAMDGDKLGVLFYTLYTKYEEVYDHVEGNEKAITEKIINKFVFRLQQEKLINFLPLNKVKDWNKVLYKVIEIFNKLEGHIVRVNKNCIFYEHLAFDYIKFKTCLYLDFCVAYNPSHKLFIAPEHLDNLEELIIKDYERNLKPFISDSPIYSTQ